MKKTFYTIIALSIATLSHAGCPMYYSQQGDYCVANSPNAKPIMPSIQHSCPPNWSLSGEWCVANSQLARPSIPREGSSCPSGLSLQGQWCVQR